MKWYPFDKLKGYRQKRPPIKKWVVVRLRFNSFSPRNTGMALGYMKEAGGDKSSPYFVVAGIKGEVIAWCDCLPEDFVGPATVGDSVDVLEFYRKFKKETGRDITPEYLLVEAYPCLNVDSGCERSRCVIYCDMYKGHKTFKKTTECSPATAACIDCEYRCYNLKF